MLFKTKQVKVIILGLNDLSIYLARILSKTKDVIILYDGAEVKTEIEDADVIIERIEVSLLTALIRYQAENTSLLIALTANDEYNIFAAQLAKKLGVQQTIALSYEKDYTELDLDINLIFNPYQVIADQINTKIKDTRLINIKNLIPGRVNLTSVTIHSDDTLSYQKIKNLDLEQSLIVAVSRSNKMFVPDAQTQLFPGDHIYFMYRKGFLKWSGFLNKKIYNRKRLFILGGKGLGLYLINYWQNFFQPIIVIEESLKQCDYLASILEKPLILNGNGIDMQLLREEGLNQSSICLAVSLNDLQNLLSSYGARKLGCEEVVTVLNHSGHKDLADLLKLDNILTIPEQIAGYLLNYLKSGLHLDKFILGNKVYTSQLELTRRSVVIDKRLKEINLPTGLIVGCVIRGSKIIIPAGDTVLQDDDKLIIFFDKKLEVKIPHIF